MNAGPADFSQGLSIPLNEASLDESKGICGFSPINWNGINGIEPSVERDLNPYPEQVADCGAVLTVLTDFNDWAATDLRIVPAGGGNGPPVEVLTPCPGPTQEQ